MNLEEHLSQEQYRQLLRVAAQEGCNYFTFNIPNTVCNDCGHIDKRYLKACPECQSKNVDYLTRVIGYLKRVSNFSKPRQKEAAARHYNHAAAETETAPAAVTETTPAHAEIRRLRHRLPGDSRRGDASRCTLSGCPNGCPGMPQSAVCNGTTPVRR